MRLPHTHPVLLDLSIACELWPQFEQAVDDNHDIFLIWCGPSHNGRIPMLVACTSEEIAARLENGWA